MFWPEKVHAAPPIVYSTHPFIFVFLCCYVFFCVFLRGLFSGRLLRGLRRSIVSLFFGARVRCLARFSLRSARRSLRSGESRSPGADTGAMIRATVFVRKPFHLKNSIPKPKLTSFDKTHRLDSTSNCVAYTRCVTN